MDLSPPRRAPFAGACAQCGTPYARGSKIARIKDWHPENELGPCCLEPRLYLLKNGRWPDGYTPPVVR